MALNTTINRATLIKDFPKLSGDPNFYINSPFTFEYNCIAFAMGFIDRWVDINDKIPGCWWPQNVPSSYEPDSLIKAFEALGFEICDTDETEIEFDKVALYKNYLNKWTHAAKVITPEKYHSKFGSSFDAIHSGLDTLDPTYGTIYCFMRRRKDYDYKSITLISDDSQFQKVCLPNYPRPLYIRDGKFYNAMKRPVVLVKDENGIRLEVITQ